MTAPVQSISSRDAWKALEAHQLKIGELHLRELFTEDPKRGDRFAIEAAGIYLDPKRQFSLAALEVRLVLLH